MALNPTSTDRVVCQCFCVRESEIRHAVKSGRARHLFDVMDQTEAGSGCNGCQRSIRKIVSEIQLSPVTIWWRACKTQVRICMASIQQIFRPEPHRPAMVEMESSICILPPYQD